MHKTYLNEVELQLINGADKIVDKIGVFPAMESARLVAFSAKKNKRRKYNYIDVELVFDISGWIHALDNRIRNARKDTEEKYLKPYRHKEFKERTIKMTFRNCKRLKIDGFPFFINGEIKFGGEEQGKSSWNRCQDLLPGLDRIIERPYSCFFISAGDQFVIFFDESECEISAELY